MPKKKSGAELSGAIATLAQRMKSQPLALALAAILVLAMVATTTVEGLRELRSAVLVIFLAAVVVWIVSEYLRSRHSSGPARGVDVSATDVDDAGQVIGVHGDISSDTSVRVQAKKIRGKVVGVQEGGRAGESASTTKKVD